MPATQVRVKLQREVTCPHCWQRFAPDSALWIAEHPDLRGDRKLGPDQPQRFLPTRFTVPGDALDPGGFECTRTACPQCHLETPRAMFEAPTLFGSILGVAGCGKSYFLAAMSWQLRNILPQHFGVSFSDLDPTMNRTLNANEELLFLNPEPTKSVRILKTEMQGELYDTILQGDQAINYPRPFLFDVRPLQRHPNYSQARYLSRILCLYDNAGEHYQPGQDTASSPVTRHLAQSKILYFLFDPTRDVRFRRMFAGNSPDPQFTDRATFRQETVLHEAAMRIRRYLGLSQHQKHTRPLIVIVTKLDAWASLLPELRVPWVRSTNGGPVCGLNIRYIESISASLRDVLATHSPELVSAAETFAEQVYYIPVSATGHPPHLDPQTGSLVIRPDTIRPIWAEVPMLYSLCRWVGGLIPYWDAQAKGNGPVQDSP